MIFLGNILSFSGQIALTSSGLIKDRLKTLLAQILGLTLLAIANGVLGGVTGCIVNSVNVLRNIIWYKNKGGLAVKIIFTVTICGLSIISANDNWLWLLPMISGLVFLWGIDLDGWKFKIMVLVSTALWLPYDLFFVNYAAVAFDVFGVVFNAFTAWRIFKELQASEKNQTALEEKDKK